MTARLLSPVRPLPRALALALLALVAAQAPAHAQKVACEAYARDYANMVAPRAGGALIGGAVQGYPNPAAPNGSRNARPQAGDPRGRDAGARIPAHQNAYAAALARCRAGR
jgi:hypothetical protein